MSRSKWIVIYGNAVDGMQFVGPFDDYESAQEHVSYERDTDWLLAMIDEPEAR